jgi:hypothetical protein
LDAMEGEMRSQLQRLAQMINERLSSTASEHLSKMTEQWPRTF